MARASGMVPRRPAISSGNTANRPNTPFFIPPERAEWIAFRTQYPEGFFYFPPSFLLSGSTLFPSGAIRRAV